MGNSLKEMSILICGDEKVGNHFIAKSLLTTSNEKISKDKYKCKGVLNNNVEIESMYILKMI